MGIIEYTEEALLPKRVVPKVRHYPGHGRVKGIYETGAIRINIECVDGDEAMLDIADKIHFWGNSIENSYSIRRISRSTNRVILELNEPIKETIADNAPFSLCY